MHGTLGSSLRSSCSIAAHSANAQTYPTPYPTYPQPQYPTYPQYPQTPTPGVPTVPAQPVVLPPYRAPSITLAQPAENGALPDDKPVAVFRFASAEPLDPIDALSFSVMVDGVERSRAFQLTQGEAWGLLADAGALMSAGQHDIRARICSARGTCEEVKATVTVVPALTAGGLSAPGSASASKQRPGRMLDAVLQAVRVLIR